MSFIEGIKEKARQDVKTIVLPESEDERTLRRSRQMQHRMALMSPVRESSIRRTAQSSIST